MFISFIPVTRATQKEIKAQSISLGIKVKIVRDYDLEKFLLETPLNRPNNERNRMFIPIRQNTSNIPFGVRGRKRKTINLVVIGVAPNPDNRLLRAPTMSDGTEPKMPARRTYERLKSTPAAKVNEGGGKRTQARLLSMPLHPDSSSMNLLTDESSTKSIDLNLDMEFGSLRFSESDSE